MSFNTIIDWNSCTAEQQRQLLMRPAISASESITRTVNDILDSVKARGDDALREYSAKFDKTTVTALKVSAEEIAAASERLSDELKQAMAVAVKNIETFPHCAKTAAGRCRNSARRALPAGHAPSRFSWVVYSWRLRPALLNGINAGDSGAYCGL
ncbi:histidinol dehydrogenase [Escherichia coli]|nr:histidinol dehydrogenase [Escherichia coli]